MSWEIGAAPVMGKWHWSSPRARRTFLKNKTLASDQPNGVPDPLTAHTVQKQKKREKRHTSGTRGDKYRCQIHKPGEKDAEASI